jgi:glycosyltransferase involved in cell wall biosynthesis
MSGTFNPCAVVPVFRHGKTLRAVVDAVMARGLPVIVVDDGNERETKDYIARLKADVPSVEVVTLPVNRGKGGAVIAGLFRARELAYTHAFQIDADGQHDTAPMADFLEAGRAYPEAVICGYPRYDESVPASRRNGRKITNLWVAIETLSLEIVDAMCGFRLYPVERTCRILSRARIGLRMTFDIEILVRLSWKGVALRFLPIAVIYPEGGVSNFRMVRDNVAISAMHTKLFFGMLLRSPILIARKVVRHG